MSEDDTRTLVVLHPDRGPGTRYDDSVRDAAFQAWAYSYGQDPTATARALELEPRTVRRWADDGRWIERLAADVQASGPMDYASTIYSYRLAARAGAAYVYRVAAGLEKGDKTRLIAAFGSADRVGISPIVRKEPNPDDDERAAFGFKPEAKLTFEQAKALTTEERDKRRFG